MNARFIATRIVVAVLNEQISLTEAFTRLLPEKTPSASLIKEICYGTLRWLPRLRFIVSQLLKKPLKVKDNDIVILLAIGIYQLVEMHIAPHAVVMETVNAAKALGKSWASGLVNAVMRSFQRQQEQLLGTIASNQEAYYAHPATLLHKIQHAWPEHWQQIAQMNNQRPPLTLRVNLAKISRADYLQLLALQGISGTETPYSAAGILLDSPLDVVQLPYFEQGYVSVQDLSAQLAATLLDLQPQQRVLDACAAPGGKTTHLLETEPQLAEVVALEKDSQRAGKITENLKRLSLHAKVIVEDANNCAKWWDGNPFDRILLDAPCSATGVIRRHPDIKYLRQENDFKTLAKQQAALLTSLWPLLKAGGILVYATCSIMPEENTDVIKCFLTQHPEAKAITIPADWGINTSVGRQILPTEQMDGFYYAVLQKS